MEYHDILSSTDETVQFSPRYESARHMQAKPLTVSKARCRLTSHKKKLRHSSKPTDSTSTLLENPKVSQSLNNHNLKLSLKSIYDSDPMAQLNKIFSRKHSASPKCRSKLVSKTLSCDIPQPRRAKVDSIFQLNEADLIMSELKTIKSPVVWQEVVKKFRQKPSVLMDLIPIESDIKLPYSSTPSGNVMSPKFNFGQSKLCMTLSRSTRRQFGSIPARSKQVSNKTPEITRPASETPIEFITFLEEKETEKLTDDWGKSLLYKKIACGEDLKLSMNIQEMTVVSRKPPRDVNMIKEVLAKGLQILRELLLELLGTQEDMERFESRFKINSPGHVRGLMDRCISLMGVRELTVEILRDIYKREMIMKNLEGSKNRIKDKVLKVYKLNKSIREKILGWTRDPSVPFDKFVFKGKEYLSKIAEDSVALQGYLAGPVGNVRMKSCRRVNCA